MTRSLALRGLLRNQTFILFLTLVAFIIIVSSLSSHFLTLSNLLNVLQQIAVVGIITVGMTVVILSGGLDISVGTVISLSASVTAVMIGNGASVAVAVIAGFAIAVVSQVVNGVIISLTKCIPIIITLGTMSIYQGFALLVTGGYTHNLQGAFQFLGRSDVLYIPVPVLVLVAVNILVFLLLKYLKFGRRVYVLGANENAAFVSGINIIGNKILVYTVHGVTAGIAAMVLVSRVGSAIAVMGTGYELRSIAAAVIGGVSIMGGEGTILGAFLGVVLLGLISNALNILNVPSSFQNVALGVVIVLAVIISTMGSKRK
jgi:ribose/xylose/arabinose/galactoside ABC-type transport system permease subunit